MTKKINKFNASWQLARVTAKKEKDVIKKIKYVINYYKNNRTISDLNRVLNWLRMTKLSYKSFPEKQVLFDKAIKKIVDDKPTKFDNESTIDSLSRQEKIDILKDLNSRKYDFQMYGKPPKDHIEFVKKLKESLS